MGQVSKRFVFLCLMYFFIVAISQTTVYANTQFDAQTDVAADKVWRISFSSFVNENSLKDAITITDDDGNVYVPEITIDETGTIANVLPPTGGYTPGVGYTIAVTNAATSIYNEVLQAPAEKSFVIEEPEYAVVEINDDVKTVTNIQLAPGSEYISFGEEGQEAETFILPNDSYKVGEIIKMDPNDEFTSGFIRKIVAIEKKDGQFFIHTVFPTLDEAFAELDINSSFELTSENVVSMELADRVVLAEGEIGSGWDFALIDYLTTIEGNAYGVNGSVKMEDVNIDVKFKKSKWSKGPHSVKLNATMVSSLTIKPQANIPLKKVYKELLNKDIKLGKFTYALPYGLTIELHAGFVIKPSVIIGAQISYTNTTDFTLGALYQNKKFSMIKEFDSRNDKATSLTGGVQVKIGPRLTVEGGFLTIGVVDMHNDFGAYGKYQKHYDLETQLGACTTKEIGAFYDMTFEIPALKFLSPLNKYKAVGAEVPLFENNGCELTTKIEFTKDKVTLEADKPYQAEVKSYWKDIVTAQTGSEKITDKVSYTTNDGRVRVSKSGKISVKDATEGFEAIVTATYTNNENVFTDELVITVEGESINPEQFIEKLKTQGQPDGYETMDVQGFYLTGKKYPEVVAIFQKQEDYSIYNIIHVYSYDQNIKQWSRVYSKSFNYGNYSIIDSGKLLSDQREQVVIGDWSGSGGFLSFILLGSEDGNSITELLDETSRGYFQGGVEFKDQTLLVCEASQGTQFKWNGTQFDKEKALCNLSQSEIKDGDIVIRYSINADEEITSNYPNNTVFQLKEGQEIHFVRENFGPTERILLSDEEYAIIPGGYNWDNAYRYYVKYSSSNILDEVKQNSRFTTEMKDADGNQYTVYFMSLNDRNWIAGREDMWAGVNIGDDLYQGDFQIAIQEHGSNEVTIQPTEFKDYQYNKTRNTVFTLESQSIGQPDFLFVTQTETSIDTSASVFFIKDGRIQSTILRTEYYESEGLFYSTAPKVIGKNKIQQTEYYRDYPFGWVFTTYEFNPSTGIFTPAGSKEYVNENYDEGKRIFEKWTKEQGYFVEVNE